MFYGVVLLLSVAACAAGLAASETEAPGCDPAHPFLSAGDFNVTKDSFEK